MLAMLLGYSLLCGLVPSVSAAEVPSLSLAAALQRVEARNPEVESAQLAEEIAAIEAQRARLDRYSATVSANGGANAGVTKPWGQDAYAAADTTWGVRATAGLPLYAGGAIRAAIDSADAGAGIARLDGVLTRRALQRAAYTAYWNIKGYELQIAAAQEGLDLTQQALAIIEAKANAGLAAGIDVNRSRVDLYSQQESLVAQRSALYQANQELLRLLHLPGDQLVLTDEAPASAGDSVAAVSEGAGDARPEFQRIDLERARAEAAVRAARSGALPSVVLSASAGVGSAASGLVGATPTYEAADLRPALDASAGLELSWNLFDLRKTHASVAMAKLAARQVDAAAEGQKASIAADIRKAASALATLRDRAPLVDARVALARDNLQIVQDLYGQGSATILDLFNAQASFREARTQGATLRVDLAIAACDLQWLLGEDPTASGPVK